MTESGPLPEQSLYQVSIEGTGLVFDINENDTLLGGILRARTGIPYECNAGGCGSCKYTLIEGEVIDDLDDSPGLRTSDRRRNKHLACISHPRSHCTIQIKTDNHYIPKHLPQKFQATLQSIEKLTHDHVCPNAGNGRAVVLLVFGEVPHATAVVAGQWPEGGSGIY